MRLWRVVIEVRRIEAFHLRSLSQGVHTIQDAGADLDDLEKQINAHPVPNGVALCVSSSLERGYTLGSTDTRVFLYMVRGCGAECRAWGWLGVSVRFACIAVSQRSGAHSVEWNSWLLPNRWHAYDVSLSSYFGHIDVGV